MNRYSELEKKISITFGDNRLLDIVFTHSSYLNENHEKGREHNERLEFLGDAVLELVATDHLYHTFPEKQEGTLTSWRSALVKGMHLAEVAKKLNLGAYLYLSKGEEKSQGRHKEYILANTAEALIGAIYLDKGFEEAQRFVDQFILKNLKTILEEGLHEDAKSKLQERSQADLGITPTYEIIQSEGPDHQKTFTVGAYIGGEKIGEGRGTSKQKAEEAAAQNSLDNKGW